MAILGVRGGTDGIPNMIFTTGETWSPNKTVQAYVYVIGAGGSGAGGGGNSDHGFSGGGAGGCAVSLLQLNAGVTYTAVIGAGGGMLVAVLNRPETQGVTVLLIVLTFRL